MPKPLSEDLRERVIEAIEGGASRRAAAERFEVSASSAVKWMQRWRQTGSVAAKPSGGCKSLLDEHSEWLLALVAGQPDLTLDEVGAAMRREAIAGSRSAVWRVFGSPRHPLQKKPSRARAKYGGSGPRPRARGKKTRVAFSPAGR